MQLRSDGRVVAGDSKIIDALNDPIGNADKVLIPWIVRQIVISASDTDRQVHALGSIGRIGTFRSIFLLSILDEKVRNAIIGGNLKETREKWRYQLKKSIGCRGWFSLRARK